jgi:hypothetical protein
MYYVYRLYLVCHVIIIVSMCDCHVLINVLLTYLLTYLLTISDILAAAGMQTRRGTLPQLSSRSLGCFAAGMERTEGRERETGRNGKGDRKESGRGNLFKMIIGRTSFSSQCIKTFGGQTSPGPAGGGAGA